MSDLTLKAFFSEDETWPIADLLAPDAAAAMLKSAAAVPAAALPGGTKALEGKLEELFDLKLGPVLQSSWQTLGAVEAAIKVTEADADAKVYVPLLDHKITTTHKPHIDLVVGGKTLAGLGFEMALTLELRGRATGDRAGPLAGAQRRRRPWPGGVLLRRPAPASALDPAFDPAGPSDVQVGGGC